MFGVRKGHLFLAGLPVVGLVVSYLGAFAVAKWIALQLGPAGTGAAGAFMGAAAMAATVSLLGQPDNIAVWVATRKEVALRQTLGLAIVTAGPVALLAVPLAALALVVLAGDQFSDLGSILGFAMMSIGQVLLLVVPPLLSTQSALRFALFIGGSALLSAAITIGLLASQVPLPMALGAGSMSSALVATIIVWNRLPRSAGPADRATRAAYVRSWLGTTPGVVVNAVVLGGLPVLVLAANSAHVAGLYRAAWTIASLLHAAATVVLRSVYLPRLAVAIASDSVLAIDRPARAGLMLAAAGGGVVLVLFGEPVLRLLYSDEFVSAAPALSWLIALVLARIWISINGVVLLANQRRRAFSIIESGSMLGLSLVTLAWSGGAQPTEMARAGAIWMIIAAGLTEVVTRLAIRSRGADVGPALAAALAVAVALVAAIFTQ